MLEQVLLYLKNFFINSVNSGDYIIEDSKIDLPFLKDGQCFRIIGSVFNDGVYLYNEELELTDEDFTGTIWGLAVPKTLLSIVQEIEQWQEKYGSVAESPYTSENYFGQYSYTKSSDSATGKDVNWQTKFKTVLAPYKKNRLIIPDTGGDAHQDPPYRKPFNLEYPWWG